MESLKCKSCGGPLVMRETFDNPVDENGVFECCRDSSDLTLYCADCGARHAYEVIHESLGRYTIALAANSDPDPVATITIGFRRGMVESIGADNLVWLVIIDEDRQEIGRFQTVPWHPESEWVERVKQLEALIQKGEHRASFKEEK